MNQGKMLDALMAGALGDAFGYAIEFKKWKEIQAEFGADGLTQWPLDEHGRLIASDDTQMTIFALQALRLAPRRHGVEFSLEDLREQSSLAFLRWHRTQTQSYARESKEDGALGYESMWRRRAPGSTCLTALRSVKDGAEARNDSKGCGAAMRAAPYAMLAERMGMQGVWDAASAQGALTHKHIDGHASGAALAWMLACEPADKAQLLAAAGRAAQMCGRIGAAGTQTALEKAIDLADADLDPERMCDLIGEGWTGDEAVGVAVWAAARAVDATSAIQLGANHRGDSDSTASMAGQLAGCMFGLNAKERSMFERLDLAEPLLVEWEALKEAWPLEKHYRPA